MVRVEVLKKRIAKLEEYLGLLAAYRNMPLEKFLSNPEHYHSAERLLQLCIEASTDMGNHIITDMNLGHADYGSQIPDILAEKELISRDLAETWIKMIGLRNILVHDYLDINHATVHELIQSRMDDFESIKAFFTQYL
jgi:uncharacterized protein YutE (UPF0331/DUF86 family)